METKLISAIRQNDIELAKKLLGEGINVNEQDEQGWTSLHWASGVGNVDILHLLLDHHADVTIEGRDNRTPLMVARAAGRNHVVEVLSRAEKVAGVWKDAREGKPYCKGYYLKDLQSYPRWPSSTGASEKTKAPDAIVYLHQDFTVTKSVWPGEDIVFNDVTPEWVQFCEAQLKFAVPLDIL